VIRSLSSQNQQDLSGFEKNTIKKELTLELGQLEMQLSNLRETKTIINPARSIKPVGTSKRLIVIVSLVVGFFLALFFVFVFEFLEKARNYAAEKSQSV